MPVAAERLRAVGFDLDGTLVDTMPDLAAAVNLMLRMLGARELPEQRVRALVGRGVEPLVSSALTESLGDTPAHAAQSEAALGLFRRLYSQALFRRSRLYPGVELALGRLAHSGLQLCCVTNKESTLAVPLLEQAGLRTYLAFTLSADRLEDRKPSPRLLLAACARLAIRPAEMMYVGDSIVDVQAARAAGCPITVVTYGYGAPTALREAAPDECIDSLTDLAPLRDGPSDRTECAAIPRSEPSAAC